MDKWFISSNVDILLLISDKIRLPIQLLLSDSVFTERIGLYWADRSLLSGSVFTERIGLYWAVRSLLSGSVDPSDSVESVKLDKKCLIISTTIFVSTV